MLADLTNYFADPEKTEKRILAAACNRKHTMGEQLDVPEARPQSTYERLERELREVEAVRDDLRARLDREYATAEATLPYPPPEPMVAPANELRDDLSLRRNREVD